MSMHVAFFALTNIHPGAPGGGISVADLPVYRDRFSLVKIRGESLKGALRSAVSRRLGDLEGALFGTTSQAGAFSILDAVLVFVPVTSAENGLIYLTSPMLLSCLARHLAVAGVKAAQNIDSVASALTGLPLNESASTINDNEVTILGEFTFKNNHVNWLNPLKNALKMVQRAVSADLLDIIDNLLVINDTAASILIEKALPIKPGVKLKGLEVEDEVYLKNVELGPWFEEEIPKFSVFSSVVMFPQRKVEAELARDEAKRFVHEALVGLSEAQLTVKENKVKVTLNQQSVSSLVKKYLSETALIVGGRETLARGLLKAAEMRFNGEWPEVKRSWKMAAGEERKTSIFLELLRETAGDLERADEFVGKFSSLPDRIRKLPLLSVYLFYTKIKGDVEGKGYREVREVMKRMRNEGLFSEEWIIGDGEIAKTKTESTSQLVLSYKTVLEDITKLKYVIRSYAKKKEVE
ncbi:MAG: type III-B CRISPR module RAMP protein Cmr4 [Candidatus Freyarchaeota archaeon]|nr:type III-B CRISPR module RAMP protein Cmr4 [Candidatus Jordarchaeia archaeon]